MLLKFKNEKVMQMEQRVMQSGAELIYLCGNRNAINLYVGCKPEHKPKPSL